MAHLATTAKEIIDSAGSYYNQTMALAELDLSKYDLPAKPRIAVVGTPCEIQGIRAMQSRRWPTGAHRIDSVVLTIALLCTKSFDYQGLMLQLLQDDRGIEIERVSKVDVIRGRMIVEYRDGEVAVDEPIKNFHGAALKGCDECADFLGRSADLSVGSVGAMDGWSSVLVRSERGRRALDNARGRLDLRELDNPGALVKLDSFDKRVAVDSLRRTFDPDAPLFIDYAEHVVVLRGHRPGPGGGRPLTARPVTLRADRPRCALLTWVFPGGEKFGRNPLEMGRVAFMTVFEVEGAPKLELPEEPVDIKVGLRDALLEGKNWRDGFSDEICIGLWLWGWWRPALEPGGMGREEFVDAVIADRRELWLWLMGDASGSRSSPAWPGGSSAACRSPQALCEGHIPVRGPRTARHRMGVAA